MKINGHHHQSIWVNPEDDKVIQVFDQRVLPHKIEVVNLRTAEDAYFAIKDMIVRGAPLIGVTAAYGVYLACLEAKANTHPKQYVEGCAKRLMESRPTAVNLNWAVNEQLSVLESCNSVDEMIQVAFINARKMWEEDIACSKRIGEFGLQIIKQISERKNGAPVNILTHCNAGWLATIDYGTATSPMYHAHEAGIAIHVWVDETRPRNQGANLTAFELNEQGIPHTLITDNTGGHLMQHGMVDMVIVGSDRTTANGDVGNKIGTYLKALAAKDNNVPFYAALPFSTIDWSINDGISEIPIETRNQDEVRYMQGLHEGELKSVLLCPQDTPALNYGFDVTPARLVTGIITEKGVCEASAEGLKSLYK